MLRFWFRFVFSEPVLSAKAEIPGWTRHDWRIFFKPPRAWNVKNDR